MSSIYEIDRQITECIDEFGEIVDIEKLDQLMMERSEKLESIACWILDINADAKAIKEQEAVLAERRKKLESKAESLKGYLGRCLNGEKLESARVSVSWRRTAAVDVAEDADIPEAYMVTKVTRSPDKAAIKAAIKAGEIVPGCSLREGYSMTVK